MRGNGKSWTAAVLLALAVAACASPPAGDVDLAKSTLDKALAAGAESFAPESLAIARQAQTALDEELKTQNRKWFFKSYDKARGLATAAQAAGDKAAADAAAGREETMAAAVAATTDAHNGPNLFRNGSFADGLQAWGVNPESDATVTVDSSLPNEHVWHVQYRKGNWGVIYQELNLRPDTVYVYEASVKSTAPIVALYWQAETGRFLEIDKTYPEWTHLRYVVMTPHWTGQPYRTGFNPVLMKGAGEAWLKNLRLSQFKPRG